MTTHEAAETYMAVISSSASYAVGKYTGYAHVAIAELDATCTRPAQVSAHCRGVRRIVQDLGILYAGKMRRSAAARAIAAAVAAGAVDRTRL